VLTHDEREESQKVLGLLSVLIKKFGLEGDKKRHSGTEKLLVKEAEFKSYHSNIMNALFMG